MIWPIFSIGAGFFNLAIYLYAGHWIWNLIIGGACLVTGLFAWWADA